MTPASRPGPRDIEAELIRLVLDGVTSLHSGRSYRTGMEAFFAWVGSTGQKPGFSKALAQQYRSTFLANGLSPSTINLRLSPVRKAARECRSKEPG